MEKPAVDFDDCVANTKVYDNNKSKPIQWFRPPEDVFKEIKRRDFERNLKKERVLGMRGDIGPKGDRGEPGRKGIESESEKYIIETIASILENKIFGAIAETNHEILALNKSIKDIKSKLDKIILYIGSENIF